MAAFSISQAAASEVRRRLQTSGLDRPAASLLDSTAAFPNSKEMVDAILRKVSDSEMHAIAKKEYSESAGKLTFRLDVGVYESEKCRPEDLSLVDGLQFILPKEMREYFVDYILDYAEGQFLLKNEGRTYLRLMDLEAKRDGAA